jgi:purine-cytosine permease-like protein
MTGYNTAVGFDLATGLGSVNALNFVNANLWAAAPPTEPPAVINRPTVTAPAAMLAIACALCLALLFVGLRRKQIRWSTAVLLLAFALSILSATRSSAANRAGNSTPQHRMASNSAVLIQH